AITIVLVLGFISANAQPFNVDVSFAVGTPQGSFGQSLDREAYGVDLGFTYQPIREIPFHFGFGLIYQNYGWRERSSQFIAGVPEVDVSVRTTNNMVTPQLLFRLEPDMGFFSPFVESSIGFNYLYTESSIRDVYFDEEIASTINYDYATSNYGIGGGAKFALWEGFSGDGDFLGVHLILKAKYMVGGHAYYLKEGDLVNRNGELIYNLSSSRTDLTTFNIGVVLNF
ncbi:MAG: PorT family protein, partial [Balneolales bacterium]|nr:PorT family protein [Balneolales bacterium]